jgi:hypothetical protein
MRIIFLTIASEDVVFALYYTCHSLNFIIPTLKIVPMSLSKLIHTDIINNFIFHLPKSQVVKLHN